MTQDDTPSRTRTTRGGAHRARRAGSARPQQPVPAMAAEAGAGVPADGGPAVPVEPGVAAAVEPGAALPAETGHSPPAVSPARTAAAVRAQSAVAKADAIWAIARSRTMIVRASAVIVLAGLIGVGLMRPGVPSAEPTVSQFLLAWESQHYLQAAELTTGNPSVVARELASAYTRLDASDIYLGMRGVDQDGTTATARFEASIDLAGSGLTWSYPNEFTLKSGPHGWRVQWSPSVIVPGMTSKEQLAVVSSWDPRSQLLDSAGQPLTVPSTVYQVGVIPGDLSNPDRTADDLAAVTHLSPSQVAGQMDQGLSGEFLPLLTLSPTEYGELKTQLATIPGLEVQRRTERLFNSIAPDVVGSVGTETASVLRINGVEYRPGTTVGLSGLQQTFQRQLTGEPRTDVVLQQAGQPAVDLKTWPGSPGKPVDTTLSSSVQIAADQALSNVASPAAIVAVQASTGKILAVASHAERGMPVVDPLSGQYQPGQAFTIISSAAILSAGRLSLSDPVPCPASNSVDGRSFSNDPPVSGIGANPSFQADFAHACSTAFAGGLAQSLTAADLAKASKEFGIGGWELPVSGYFAGSIPAPASQGKLAADLIGTGDVRVSPLGMALAASVVDSGRWHSPSLVTGMADASASAHLAASQQVLTELRSLMRAAAQAGPNRSADIGSDVYGQMGSAPYGSRQLHVNWFVGYQGDVAFAVIQLDKSASASASSLAGSFLQNIRAGS